MYDDPGGDVGDDARAVPQYQKNEEQPDEDRIHVKIVAES